MPTLQEGTDLDCALQASHRGFFWVPDLPPSRNLVVSFERRFVLESKAPAHIHLFADSRYRLWVNERFVGYGPARFVTSHPEFDSYEIGDLLERGKNLIRVEVNFYGAPSFQTMPDGMPGLHVSGGIPSAGLTFNLPEGWRARVHQAWDTRAPHFSFAQNPCEILDTRLLAKELQGAATQPVVPVPSRNAPWGKLQPRSVPMPDYRLVTPVRITVQGPAAPAKRWAIRPDQTNGKPWEHCPTKKMLRSLCGWIHSPRDQDVALEIFWADVEVNGVPAVITAKGHEANHGVAQVRLSAGWNFLSACYAVLTADWSFLVGLPEQEGLSLHALPDLKVEEALAISPIREFAELLPPPDSPAKHSIPPGWTLNRANILDATPARWMAWTRPDPSGKTGPVALRDHPLPSTYTASEAIWCFDFGDEYFGQPVLEVEAPAGSILDVGYDDWLRADGCINLYNSNPFTDSADRFILRGGRQRIEVMNPRGGIFMQLILRVPAGMPPAPLSVHMVGIRRRTLINFCEGRFASGDPLMDWVWRTSTRTLMRSTDETYSDCPWRERSSYIGDGLVNLSLQRLITTDLSVAKRTIGLFAQAALPGGQIPCSVPSCLDRVHEDYTLLWIFAVRDLWAITGEHDLLDRYMPVVDSVLDGDSWKPDSDGLWTAEGLSQFIDWGVLPEERGGDANSVLNILRIAALRQAAEMEDARGNRSAAARRRLEANNLEEALIRVLWDSERGAFRPSRKGSTPALHANILALRYGVGDQSKLIAYLEPRLRSNFRRGLEHGPFKGFAELYFFYFLLPGLAHAGKIDLALDLIQETYGFIKSLNFPTLPECFHRAREGLGSCCHSWSGAPALFATNYILGLRQKTPGNPDLFILDPLSKSHCGVSGSLPHRLGTIEIRWVRTADGIRASASIPEGVHILPAQSLSLTINRS